VSRQYKVAMVDESQDVNPMQYNLLQAMGLTRVMMVGDVQQSIYGFRQADVELFRNRAAEVGARRLSKNYRSSPGILNFVDLVFANLWGADYVPMNLKTGPMDFEDTSRPTFEGIELWHQAAQDTNATATYIQELLDEGIPHGDIAVLVRDGPGAVKMKEGLDGVAIPCRIAGGSERFYTRLEVRDLSNALRAVADPYDDFALLACLRGPMVGLSMDSIVLLGTESPVVERLETFIPPLVEDEPRLRAFLRWYMPLKNYADRLSAWEVLAELFAKSEYLPALARRPNAEQLLANARKLLTLATKEPELGPLEYAERIREIQDLRHKEGDAPAGEEDANVVTIMTIHKAKGLEFPVVVLPQTDRRLASNAPEVIVEPRKGLVATKFGRGQCLMHKYLADLRKQRAVEEELRVLYVGLTRPRQRLCIVLYPNTSKETVSKRLKAILGDVPPEGVVVRRSQDLTEAGVPL
jgi:ATP-dependent exoDNAse (exonuclease V) beta subunit